MKIESQLLYLILFLMIACSDVDNKSDDKIAVNDNEETTPSQTEFAITGIPPLEYTTDPSVEIGILGSYIGLY